MSRQPLGQHFLRSEAWRSRILEELGPAPPSLRNPCATPDSPPWIEIGAGGGEITADLADRGAPVIAIETDSRLASLLRARRLPGVEILHADFLSLDLAALDAAGIEGRNFRVYGNLPYYITSPILHHLFKGFRHRIRDVHIVIQREVAKRIAAAPCSRARGYLSAFCQFYAHPEILVHIPPGAFQPPPKVMSTLLRLTPPGESGGLAVVDSDVAAFFRLVKACFAHKRKNLRNNLQVVAPKASVATALAAAQIPPFARAEELSLSAMAALFHAFRAVDGFSEPIGK
jgi:16S rRNA (adenine1518-N6/adenine1519-N6)-dimethyltransferase